MLRLDCIDEVLVAEILHLQALKNILYTFFNSIVTFFNNRFNCFIFDLSFNNAFFSEVIKSSKKVIIFSFPKILAKFQFFNNLYIS